MVSLSVIATGFGGHQPIKVQKVRNNEQSSNTSKPIRLQNWSNKKLLKVFISYFFRDLYQLYSHNICNNPEFGHTQNICKLKIKFSKINCHVVQAKFTWLTRSFQSLMRCITFLLLSSYSVRLNCAPAPQRSSSLIASLMVTSP